MLVEVRRLIRNVDIDGQRLGGNERTHRQQRNDHRFARATEGLGLAAEPAYQPDFARIDTAKHAIDDERYQPEHRDQTDDSHDYRSHVCLLSMDRPRIFWLKTKQGSCSRHY